jgi:hypothetical protein
MLRFSRRCFGYLAGVLLLLAIIAISTFLLWQSIPYCAKPPVANPPFCEEPFSLFKRVTWCRSTISVGGVRQGGKAFEPGMERICDQEGCRRPFEPSMMERFLWPFRHNGQSYWD